MIKALLLDLDDTLLLSPKDAYLQTLLLKLGQFLVDDLQLPEALGALQEASASMSAGQNPLLTNRRAFQQSLSAASGLAAAVVEAELLRFYRDIYPDLQALTQPDPLARALVESCLAQGCRVVLATNPVYPMQAIQQRVAWAGLADLLPHFAWVTSADNAHYAKPQPEYYAEILAHLGLEPQEALMIGDNWVNDIIPAQQVGLYSFWVSAPTTSIASQVQPDARGSLADLLTRLEQGWLATLPAAAQQLPQPAQLLYRLRGNVAALAGMAEETPPHFWQQRPDPNEWTPLEIVTHLADSEAEVQRPRLLKIVQQENPFLVAASPPPQPGEWQLNTQDAWAVMERFAAERQQTLDFLDGLPPELWLRPARHSVYGPTNFLEMVLLTARHDQLHLQQFCQTRGQCQ